MNVRVQTYIHGHTCRSQSKSLECLSLPLHCLKPDSLIAILLRLADQQALRIHPLLSCNTGVAGNCSHA